MRSAQGGGLIHTWHTHPYNGSRPTYTMNRFQMRPGLEGIYKVGQSRALHWPCKNGKPVIWATAGQFVDLRSPFMMELVQMTGQLHKLAKVDKVPKGKKLLGAADAPAVVRDALKKFEAGQPSAPAAPRTAADGRRIDESQFPSAAPPADEDEDEDEDPVAPDSDPDPDPDDEPDAAAISDSTPAPTSSRKGGGKAAGASKAKGG